MIIGCDRVDRVFIILDNVSVLCYFLYKTRTTKAMIRLRDMRLLCAFAVFYHDAAHISWCIIYSTLSKNNVVLSSISN